VGGNDKEFRLRLLAAPGIVIRHRLRKRSRVPVDGPCPRHNNILLLATVHFKPERIGRVFAAHSTVAIREPRWRCWAKSEMMIGVLNISA
jgi:hypothetical protein